MNATGTASIPTWPVISVREAHAQLTEPGARFELEEIEVRGRKTRTWKNAPPTLRDVFVAACAHRPERIYMV